MQPFLLNLRYALELPFLESGKLADPCVTKLGVSEGLCCKS